MGMVECVGGDIEMLVEDLLFARSAVSLVMDGDNCFQLAASETSPRPSQAPPNTSHHHFWAKLGIKTKSFSLLFVLNCWLIMTFMTCLSRIMYVVLVLYRGKDVTNTTFAPSVEHNLATFLIIKT